MSRLDPRERPPLRAGHLIRRLADFEVRWVLCGSQVLALHGAPISPNDLDVVPELAAENLSRVAACLDALKASAAYLDGWGGSRGTLEACRNWRPDPATAENLDWLFVTRLGMLDIVIEKADGYVSLMDGATCHTIGGMAFWACDPRRVLKALEDRTRAKDTVRQAIYRDLRQRLGMPVPPIQGKQ